MNGRSAAHAFEMNTAISSRHRYKEDNGAGARTTRSARSCIAPVCLVARTWLSALLHALPLFPIEPMRYQRRVNGVCSLPTREVDLLPKPIHSTARVPLQLTVLWLLAVGGWSRNGAVAAEVDPRAPGTIRMAERLELIAKTVDPLNARF